MWKRGKHQCALSEYGVLLLLFLSFVFLKVSSLSLKYFDAECFFSVWGGNVETWKKIQAL